MTQTLAPQPKTRRWLASAIAAAAECEVSLPFQRGNRRRPAAFAPETPARHEALQPAPRPMAMAAR